MERKELTIYRVGWDSATENYDDLKMAYTLDWDAEVILKSEADSVMDVYEARIKELEASQPNWISFYDKVPNLYQNILVNVPGANKENRMEPTRSIFWCPARADELKVGLLYYTHWMPLPNPPTDEVK